MKWKIEGSDQAGKQKTVLVTAATEQEAINTAYRHGVTADTIVEAEVSPTPIAPLPPSPPSFKPLAGKTSQLSRWSSIPLLGKIAIIWVGSSIGLVVLLAVVGVFASSPSQDKATTASNAVPDTHQQSRSPIKVTQNPSQELLAMIDAKDAAGVKRILRASPELAKVRIEKYGISESMLRWAVVSSNPSVIQALVDAGADVNESDDNCLLAWCLLSNFNHGYDGAVVLIRGGANVNPSEGMTPLSATVTGWLSKSPKRIDMMRLLIEKGARVNEYDMVRPQKDASPRPTRTPLHWAATRSDVIAAQYLLDAGADINATGGNIDQRATPLQLAQTALNKAKTPADREAATAMIQFLRTRGAR